MKLKFLLSVWTLCVTLLSQAGNVVGGPFIVKGSLKGADGKKIYLQYGIGDKSFMDSTVIRKGTFVFKGNLESPFVVGGLVFGNKNDMRNLKWCSLFLESTTITVDVTLTDFSSPKVKGSVSQTQYNEFQSQIANLSKEMNRLHDAVTKEQNIELRNKYSASLDSCEELINKAQMEFIKTHPDSYVSSYLMMPMMGHMMYNEANAIYQSLTPNVKKYGPYISDIEKELASMERVQPGKLAPDFTTTDINSNQVSFSEMRGKYVLLDFWASWCVPCRRSFPHVKALYNKYKDKGFDVFCVGDNDSSPEQWRAAIKKDGIDMFHHVLRGMKMTLTEYASVFDKTNDISSKYAVHYLPTKYLIDKEGKIIGQFEDEQLDAKLKEIFGF